jgi:hypothetical protein
VGTLRKLTYRDFLVSFEQLGEDPELLLGPEQRRKRGS